jgi:hypothetical protein
LLTISLDTKANYYLIVINTAYPLYILRSQKRYLSKRKKRELKKFQGFWSRRRKWHSASLLLLARISHGSWSKLLEIKISFKPRKEIIRRRAIKMLARAFKILVGAQTPRKLLERLLTF